ncbi:hypothetical protein M407DRAFT_20170 [Tulasnella calospora MUT 4182]|uniref:Uncharacterized protein n=1 Tax=Tulasnella calospora MUT 4182 TaxID=1051891 RepID=A0A0C3QQP1_9AGAM|nr:hypothetical protein M407DRAFT_20170 [Tulasnella calospora MUT 4182]
MQPAISLLDMTHSSSINGVGSSQPPIHRLPYDDLHLIFSLCWDPSSNTFPITASHVCRRWRSFILEMPAFWSHVRFHHEEHRLSMESYATWILRSKDAPLNIMISDKPFKESATRNVEAIMKLIGPHTQRWRSFQIDHAALKAIRIILDHLSQCSLPQLENLRIVEWSNGFRGRDEPEWGSLGRLAFDTPQLRELELVGVVADFSSPLFHNLQTLHLEDEYFEQLEAQTAKNIIHQILRQSPHLKQLHLENPRFRVRLLHRNTPSLPPTIEDPLSHSSLLDLTLDLRRTAYDAIIPSIKFPALCSICSPRKSTVTLDSWHLQSLARNSPFPSLKQISLSGHTNNPQHNLYLPDALSSLTSVEQLGLEQFDMAQVANALANLGHSCPQLGELDLYNCTKVDLNEIRSLVDRRLRVDGMTGLRNVRILGGVDDAFPELEATKKWLRQHVKHVTLFTDGDWNEYAYGTESLP